MAVVGLSFLIPVFDDVHALANYDWTFGAVRDILISAVLAVLVNVSTFCIVGKTSAVTFTVVGHVKTIGVFLFGFLLFQAVVTFKNLVGIAITLAGAVWYSKLKMAGNK